MDRRGFLTALGTLIAAPAVVRAASIMPVRRPTLVTVTFNNKLLQFRREVVKEYVRQSLFNPYSESIEVDDYRDRMWVDWARNAMPVA